MNVLGAPTGWVSGIVFVDRLGAGFLVGFFGGVVACWFRCLRLRLGL